MCCYTPDVHGINAIDGSGDPMDDGSHGTHCTGTIGAVGNNLEGVAGVNWQVSLMGCKFMSPELGGGYVSGAIQCIDYAIEMGAHVTSNSWLVGSYSWTLEQAVKRARDVPEQPQLFVAAAGNSAHDNDLTHMYPASFPEQNVVAVASTDSSDILSWFSHYGVKSVDLAAPGSHIVSTVPGGSYAAKSGTSMATPHVTGAIAYIMSVDSSLGPLEIKELLMSSGDPLPALAGRTVSGKRLNVFKALESRGGPAPDCEDDPDYYQGRLPRRDCAWIARKPNKRCRTWCRRNANKKGCPAACALCTAEEGAPAAEDVCEDDPAYLRRNKPNRDCTWIGKKVDRRCRSDKDKTGCPVTCGVCAPNSAA